MKFSEGCGYNQIVGLNHLFRNTHRKQDLDFEEIKNVCLAKSLKSTVEISEPSSAVRLSWSNWKYLEAVPL